VSDLPFLWWTSHEIRFRYASELPYDLAREIEDVQQHGGEVKEVSIGLDGDWFLRTNTRCGRFSSDLASAFRQSLHP